MVEFVYNNTKNASTDHTSFKVNYAYYLWVFLDDKVNSCSRSYSANRSAKKLSKLIFICEQNLLYAQKLQK